MLSRLLARSHVGFASLVLGILAMPAPAVAGPPLLCHPFDIGGARSLPWNASGSWQGGLRDYPLGNLVADTTAILTPATPVIVRIETLRRAAIYASRDAQVAARLFTDLTNKARAAEQAGHPDALAYLDAAYYVEALRQISELAGVAAFRERAPLLRALVQGTDGYALATKSIAARPGDPAIQFTAALIASDRHRDRYAAHAEKARAGANQDALLARNIGHLG
jgi:hypothetical protein